MYRTRKKKLSFSIDDQRPPVVGHALRVIPVKADRGGDRKGKNGDQQKHAAWHRHCKLFLNYKP